MDKNCEHCINFRKVVIIGCGFVGAATAFSLMESGLFTQMVLIDSKLERAEGEALDISHGVAFNKPMEIYAGSYDDIEDACSYDIHGDMTYFFYKKFLQKFMKIC